MPRKILDNYRDDDGLPVTGTFAAYMIEGGYRHYRDAQDAGGFAAWHAERIREFTPIGIILTVEDRSRFLDWLDERAHDQIARKAVEAA